MSHYCSQRHKELVPECKSIYHQAHWLAALIFFFIANLDEESSVLLYILIEVHYLVASQDFE